jgi:hypothetical protein
MPPFAERTSHGFIGLGAVEPFRIEPAAAPALEVPLLIELIFFGLEKHAQKFRVAAGAADILWRAASCTAGADRSLWSGRNCEQVFECHLMRPVVAKIVDVLELDACAPVKREILDENASRLEGARFIAVQALAFREIGVTITKSANQEMMEMAVRPAEGYLQDVMKLSKVQAEG